MTGKSNSWRTNNSFLERNNADGRLSAFRNRFRVLFFFCFLLAALSSGAAVLLQVRPDIESGIYQPGQIVRWRIGVFDEGKPVSGNVQYTVNRGGAVPVDAGFVNLNQGRAEVTSSRDDPGVLLLEVKFKPTGQAELTEYGGAVVGVKKIAPSKPAPSDFDAFWKAKIAELRAIPMNVHLERVNVGDPTIEYYRITMDNIRGTRIYGQLARPAGDQQHPAMLGLLWAGVYPLDPEWVCGNARQGWLTLMISPHNLPIDQPPSFYAAKGAGELKNYWAIGNDDRETSYFLRMFLGTHRAIDYLTNHRNWNKRALVLHGSSQGGYQAIVAAGLHPAVTGFFALVPVGCDTTGAEVGRIPCWPNGAAFSGEKDVQKVMETARYFDAMNFARRINCRSLVGVGLLDRIAATEGVLATCNLMRGSKEVLIMPLTDHDNARPGFYEKIPGFLAEQASARTFDPPLLSWTRTSNGHSVSWPIQSADYVLERKFFPGTNGWRRIRPGSTNFGVVSATVGKNSTNRFFRLKK